MGFTTGFLGGLTITATTIYLTISLHTSNRLTQRTLLRQQTSVLTNIVSPQPVAPEPVAREVDAGLVEMAKDRWNREVEGVVRRVHGTDWRRVREQWEDRVGNVISKLREEGGK
ncbi:hypothetical protein K469DRAFT_738933 [Zopfia rhizophila CBS 207.26]|uniref:MICOS complex subunit MIC12 n=1 Tax=Zopfia rhizophila CBS 207.26 TaxID=1314779 RepID=A0A6A6E1G6_9PEZI|nr:hypothetical protein K469DRAFT_738933 [Zopfia rhizophila CBS 207.26]